MENSSNLHSYDNVEKEQFFLEKKDFEAYCRLKLESAKGDVEFIKRNIYKGTPLKACELGTGNGKLLFSLERENILDRGIGYEVSESRCKFARRFKEFLDVKRVSIVNKSFLDEVAVNEKYDLIIAVDIVFQMISPLYDAAEEEVINWIVTHLKDEGKLILELEDFSKTIAEIESSGIKKSWEEFPEGDIFQYGLYRMGCDMEGNVVDDKVFLKRNGAGKDCFRNIIKSYSKESISRVLEAHGMECQIFTYYDEYDLTPIELRKDLYRVLAWKK